jgi:serine/threonine protein kinase
MTGASENSFIIPQVIENFTFGETIGFGGFGAVLQGVHSVTNQKHAVKVISKKFLINRNEVARFNREIMILSCVDSAHCAKFYGLLKGDELSSTKGA